MSRSALSAETHGYDIASIVSLLALFDFSRTGTVSREEWQKGTKILMLAEMGEDDKLWDLLLRLYDTDGTGEIDLSQLQDLVSVDPRMSLLLNAMVSTISSLNEKTQDMERKATMELESKKKRVLLNVRRRFLLPVLSAWAEYTRGAVRQRRLVDRMRAKLMYSRAYSVLRAQYEEALVMRRFAKRFANREAARLWRRWAEHVDEQHKMRKFGRRMAQSGVARALNHWVEQVEERRRLQSFMQRALQGGVARAFDRAPRAASRTEKTAAAAAAARSPTLRHARAAARRLPRAP